MQVAGSLVLIQPVIKKNLRQFFANLTYIEFRDKYIKVFQVYTYVQTE